MSGSGEATTLWARAFVDELARAGVRDLALAPGSRSTPLVMAAARDGRLRLRVHLDERSASYFALGAAKASGEPAAVLTTSGTAAANLLPAVVEAAMGETPLLVLTADRPHRLRDADANQAIDQVRLYGTYARAFFDVAPPALDGPGLRHLRTLAGRAVEAATGPPAGPVHLNFPFDKPLEPEEGAQAAAFAADHPLAAAGRAGGAPFVDVRAGAGRLDEAAVRKLGGLLASPRGVVVAGPGLAEGATGDEAAHAVRRLAAVTGFPVLADPLSGVRFGDPCGAHVVAAYDLFLGDAVVRARLAPSVVLRVGRSPTSAALADWLLDHNGVPHVVVDGGGRWKDHAAVATHYVRADAADTLRRLTEGAARTADGDWVALWGTAEHAARGALVVGPDRLHEGDALAAVASAAPAGATLFVSSSMPVRDLDAFGHPRTEPLRVLANRGASGIDGVVSTAFGVASRSDGPTICVLGDLALFHDQNGLLWSREPDAAVVFVLIDNDGGGIFHRLPIADREPEFSTYFATPHGLDFSHAAAMHGIPLEDAGILELPQALARAAEAARTSILRVRTDRARSHARRAAVADDVRRAVREAVG